MTRRLARVLTSSACVAALVAACACGGGTNETPAFRDAHPLPEEPMVVPVPSIGTHGGRFVVAQTAGPQTFNGIMAIGTPSTSIAWQTFVGLTGFDNEAQQVVPALAKNWEVGPDGLTWTFRLRKGAAFSDGHPITAEDVVFSFEAYLDDTLQSPSHDRFMTDGKKWNVTAPDAYTVVVQTPRPNAVVPELVSYSSFLVMPKHVLEAAFRSGNFASAYGVSTPPAGLVTSGAWRIQEHVPGEKTVLARNPYWFGVDAELHRLPYLDELVHLIVPDQDAADLKFRAGEADGFMASSVKPENYRWYEEHQQEGRFTLHRLGPALATSFFWFNLNTVRKAAPGRPVGEPWVGRAKYGWFNSRTFRQAVSLAVDRDAMISSVYFGAAEKNWSQQTRADRVWSSPDIINYDYNLAEAKRLLSTLRWTDRNGDGFLEDAGGTTIGFTLKTDSSNTYRVAMANFIRDDLAKVGIKVTLAPVALNTLIGNVQDDFQYEAALLGLQAGVPPNPAQGQDVFRSSGRQHFWNTEQPKPATPEEARIDALLDTIVGAPDLDARKDAWQEIENIVNYECWLIWLPTIDVRLPLGNRFGNARPSAIPPDLLWNIDRVYVKTSGQS